MTSRGAIAGKRALFSPLRDVTEECFNESATLPAASALSNVYRSPTRRADIPLARPATLCLRDRQATCGVRLIE